MQARCGLMWLRSVMQVWRPNSEIEYISDAMGSVVAWPNDKIKFV